MTPELWQRLKPLFAEALQQPSEIRAAYIDGACADDDELKHELKRLLTAEQEATGPLGVQAMPGSRGLAIFAPGQVVLDRFKVVRWVDGGGMGEVYEAEDLLLGQVALKTVRADLAALPELMDRLRQEVQLARKVSGLQVCRIHELFLVPAAAGRPASAFLSMEYIDGETLASRVGRGGPLAPRQALRIALEICEGLRLIHAQGIVHRDLKPGNIMLCGEPGAERVVLMDFGLAHLRSTPRRRAADATSLVSERRADSPGIAGSPAYMAPEQFEEGKPVTPATDLYALGVVLYEILTGVQPYSASTPFAAAVRRAKQPRPASALQHGVPRSWDRVILGCLRYEAGERYQSAEEVATALRASPYRLDSLWNDRRGLVQVAFAMLLCALGWVGVLAWQSWRIYRPTGDAARFYTDGINALHEGTYLKATHALNAAVERAPEFAMAHVRLAEAWNSLDFQGNAQQELLLAMPGEGRLSQLDRLELQAVRDEVTGDFTGAAEVHRQMLGRLPANEQSAGYVDLGFAEERGGEPMRALAEYAKASSLDANNGAAFLHTAILQARLHHTPEAQQAFDRAEGIYRAEINQEGLANLHYERGSAASVLGRSAEAKALLDQSLREAQEISSVQLQIRSLQQLSVAVRDRNAMQAEVQAKRAIELARMNRLDSWAAIGLVRLAEAKTWQGRLPEARETADEGLELARQTRQTRVEALANALLANLEDEEGHAERVIAPAQKAIVYFQQNGFFTDTAMELFLMARALGDLVEFPRALEVARASREMAIRSGDTALLSGAEQVLGTVTMDMENYPDAIAHFQEALRLGSDQGYGRLFLAEPLTRVGRRQESRNTLALVPSTPAFDLTKRTLTLAGVMADRKYTAALQLTEGMKRDYPNIPERLYFEVLQDQAISEAHLSRDADAFRDLRLAREMNLDSGELLDLKLASAEVNLTLRHFAEAGQLAQEAAAQAKRLGKRDTELRSVSLAAAAARGLGMMSTAADLTQRLVDILTFIRKDWPKEDVASYLARADISALLGPYTNLTPS